MPWNRNYRERKSPRLAGWDYRTPGWYFITICTQNRYYFFGKIRNGIMGLSQIGNVAHQNWAAISDHFDHVVLGEWIVMPNHVHGLIGIMEWPVKNNDTVVEVVETCHGMSLPLPNQDHGMSLPNQDHGTSLPQGGQFGKPQPGSVSTIINQYKSSVTRWARKNNHTDFAWQARFHDHIVRDERSLDRIRHYIYNNPLKWESDQFYEQS